MQSLVKNIENALDVVIMDLCRVRINSYDKDINPYVIISDIASIKIRINFLNLLLEGVELDRTNIDIKMKKIKTLIKEVEGIELV